MNNSDDIETVVIGRCQIKLPSAICTDPIIFNSIFSQDTWENVLSSDAKQRILQNLPKEILNQPGLAAQTIQEFFSGELNRFDTSPLESFFNHLDGGLFDPGVVLTKQAIKKVWRKDSKRLMRKYQTKVFEELLLSTEKYFDKHIPTTLSNGFDTEINLAPSNSDFKVPSNPAIANRYVAVSDSQSLSVNSEDEPSLLEKRVRKRFHTELSTINAEADCVSSDDDEFPVKKKPTRYTTGLKLDKHLNLTSVNKIGDKQTIENQPGSHPNLSSSVPPVVQPQSLKTGLPNIINSVQQKTVSKPVPIKSREEQMAAEMAKFPTILPAPSTSLPAVTSTPAISTSVISSVKTNLSEQNATKLSGISQAYKSSPLLASQLQAPLVSSNRRQNPSFDITTDKAHSPIVSCTNSFNMNFERAEDDEMESSSEDEFESIEPTIGFGSTSSCNNLSSSSYVAAKNSSSRPTPKASRGVANQVKGLHSSSKPKSKIHNKSTNPKLNVEVNHLSKLVNTTNTQFASSSLVNTAVTSVPVSPACSSSASPSYAKPVVVGSLQYPNTTIGRTCTISNSGAVTVRFPSSPIFLSSSGSNSSATNVISTFSSSLTAPSQFQTTSPHTLPNFKLTPTMVLNPVATNKLFSTAAEGIACLSEIPTANTSSVMPIRSLQSASFSNNAIVSGNPSLFILNGSKQKELISINSPQLHGDGAKTSAAGVFRIECGSLATAPSIVGGLTSSTPTLSKSTIVSSRISTTLTTPMVSPISVQDLKYTLNFDGNIARSNAKSPKLLSDNTEDKIDDLSGLDGNPFDSIPNLSDELDGFDLDLVEVCDFNSLVSDEKHYASFFSLIRDVLCSTRDHRMTFVCLEKTILKWSVSPSAASNSWYSNVCDWNEALTTALNFLAGNYQDAHPEDFVPYIEYKYKTKYYQWIGAGRDSDNNMLPLCNMWLQNLGRLPPIKKIEGETDEQDEDDDDNEDSDSPDLEVKKKLKRPQTPPPPRCMTSWTVRPSNSAEKDYFQEQERQRFDNPHKAFTYRLHEYESVVGPVKGVYSSQSGMTNKARGHSLLVDDRPPYVTILALVRDAVARLPNGEGTRSEICEMLRDSAFLAPEASNITLNSVVSGALDRLHYERDPCVRYDSHKKSWIYLHRDRNQEQFERLHHNRSYTKSTKSRSSTSRKARKHNKSTSSSGSQSHGPLNSTPCTSPTALAQPISSPATPVATSNLKLPPIETVLIRPPITSTNHLGTISAPSNFKRREPCDDSQATIAKLLHSQLVTHSISSSNHLGGEGPKTWQSVSLSTGGLPVSTTYSGQSTAPAANMSMITNNITGKSFPGTNPSNTSVKNIAVSTSPTMNSQGTTLPLVSTPSLQLNASTGQFVLGQNNVMRFGNPVRFGDGLRLTSVRVPVSTSSVAGGGLRLSPRIVLRGNLPIQNQGIIVGQTASGQTIILSATPSPTVGALQMQIPGSTQLPTYSQSTSSNSAVSGSTINFSPTNSSLSTSGHSLTVPNVGVSFGNKPSESNVMTGTLHLNASVASKLLTSPAGVPNLLSGSSLQSQLLQGVTQSNNTMQLSKQLAASTSSNLVVSPSMTQTPILIRSSQGNFVVPGRISYGTGGEYKMIPISGGGNQTLIARIVPQPPQDASQPPSLAAVRFSNSLPQNQTSSGQH